MKELYYSRKPGTQFLCGSRKICLRGSCNKKAYPFLVFQVPSKLHIVKDVSKTISSNCMYFRTSTWLSPRPISDSQLRALLHFHLCPIYLVVFKGSYFFRMGYLILRGASRLDAFSVYPCQTQLLGHAVDTTTDTPEVRPSRSSRTKDSSSQISYARAG